MGSGQIWSWFEVDVFLLCRLLLKFCQNMVWRLILWLLRGSNTFLVYNSCAWRGLFNLASMTPHRSALESSSKALELVFTMLKLLRTKHVFFCWRGTWCPITHVQTDHYRHARQVLWWLLRYLPYSTPLYFSLWALRNGSQHVVALQKLVTM